MSDDDALEQVMAARRRLKVFPLPSLVLFPASSAPLHIFEPRYQAMVQDCLAGDGVIGLAQLQAGWEPHYSGRPPLAPLFCAGRLVAHRALEGGRYNIVVEGVCRARVLTELPADKLYREVEAELLPDPPYAGEEEAFLRQALLELCAHLPVEEGEALLQGAGGVGGGALADWVAAALVGDIEDRWRMLTELEVGARLRRAVEVVVELSAHLAAGRGPVSGPMN